MTDRGRLALVCALLGGAGGVVVVARLRWPFALGAGPAISPVGLGIQLAALVAGVAAIHAVPVRWARVVLAIEGAACTLALSPVAGAACLAGLAAWYLALAGSLGAARWPLLVLLLGGLHATAWTEAHVAGLALSMAFSLRLVVYAWDRWRHDFARTSWLDYAAYLLVPVLVIVPPFVAFIPVFDGFSARITPGMSRARVVRSAYHLALALGFGVPRAVLTLRPALDGVAHVAVRWAEVLLHTAAICHLVFGLLLLHGIEERPPLRRPLLATRYLELWSRYMIHLKDLQVAMFYTPALLRFRRANRYLALIAATAWTMLVGNLALHAVVGYTFYVADDPTFVARLGWIVVVNAIIATALAVDLCRDEWRRRYGAPRPSGWRAVLGWLYTMTILAICSAL